VTGSVELRAHDASNRETNETTSQASHGYVAPAFILPPGQRRYDRRVATRRSPWRSGVFDPDSPLPVFPVMVLHDDANESREEARYQGDFGSVGRHEEAGPPCEARRPTGCTRHPGQLPIVLRIMSGSTLTRARGDKES
jgi:hypothetical protein